MIAVTVALPVESSAFARSLQGRVRVGFITRGILARKEIALVHTGVGSEKCRERLVEFFRRNKPETMISTGFCGGTSDDLRPGDMVIAQNFSQPELAKRAGEILSHAASGKLHSADRVIDPAADRYSLGRNHGAIAIDMETETIARLCAEFAVPLLALRVISDSPAAPFPAPPELLFDLRAQRTRLIPLFSHLARHPGAIGAMAIFSRQIALAKNQLAKALQTIVREL